MLFRIGRREAMRKKQVLQLLTMLTATAAVCGGLFLRHQPMEVAAVRVEKGNICRTVGVAGTVCYTQETPVTAMFLNVKRVLNVCPSACEHHSRIIRNLLGELAEKNLRFGEKLTHMGQRTTRAKLMSYFSAEAQRLGTYEFDIPFSRQQLADYLAVERSGLSLELGKMRSEGLLDFHKSHFILKV